eukprot:198859-Prymnesium_polylepis.1
MSQSALDRTGVRKMHIAEQIRWPAACAVGMGGCAQGREARRSLSRRWRYCAKSNFGRLYSSPGVARTKTAPVRLFSLERARQAQAAGLRPDGSEL